MVRASLNFFSKLASASQTKLRGLNRSRSGLQFQVFGSSQLVEINENQFKVPRRSGCSGGDDGEYVWGRFSGCSRLVGAPQSSFGVPPGACEAVWPMRKVATRRGSFKGVRGLPATRRSGRWRARTPVPHHYKRGSPAPFARHHHYKGGAQLRRPFPPI